MPITRVHSIDAYSKQGAFNRWEKPSYTSEEKKHGRLSKENDRGPDTDSKAESFSSILKRVSRKE